MGYSNNKWRKILTILMIINLCFVLFAKITKSFGAFYDITYNNYTFNVSENLNQYNLICLISKNGSYYHLEFKISEKPVTILYQTDYGYRIKFNSSMWGGNSSNSKYPDTNFFNSTIGLANNGARDTDLGADNFTTDVQVWANYNVKDTSGNVVIPETTAYIPPYFDNIEEIRQGYPESVIISRGDYSENDALYFHLLKITNTVPDGNQSTYYYDSKVFKLTKDSKYYKTYDADTDNKHSYYYIDRSALTLDTDSSYLYVISNSGNSLTNSYGILQPDVPGGIYDVVESDTAGVITEQQALNDKITNINNNQQEFQKQQQEFQNQNSILPETETDIDTNLNFSNNAPQFSSLFNGFFSRLTSTISDLGNYKDTDVITVHLPIPFTNDTLPIRSDIIFSNQNNNFLKNITTLLWYFIFGRYFLYFLINTYWLITNGQFFNNYLTQKEAITSDML